MKKLLNTFIVCIFSLTFLTNCGSDDVSPLDQLVGNWVASSITVSDCTDTSGNGVLACTPFCLDLVINGAGDYTLTSNLEDESITESGTAEVTSNTILLCETGEDECPDANSYTLDGSTLIISFANEEFPGCVFVATYLKQ